MPEQVLSPEKRPAEKPFPWRCPKCHQTTVSRVTMPYHCQRTHGDRIVTVKVPNLAVPRCSNCGEVVFDYSADEQIRAAFRTQFGPVETAKSEKQNHQPDRAGAREEQDRRRGVGMLATTIQGRSSQTNDDQLVVYFFNNCHNRDHGHPHPGFGSG